MFFLLKFFLLFLNLNITYLILFRLHQPFCITVDHQTLEDQTVTIRHRDSMAQDRVKISELRGIINEEVSMRNWLMRTV